MQIVGRDDDDDVAQFSSARAAAMRSCSGDQQTRLEELYK